MDEKTTFDHLKYHIVVDEGTRCYYNAANELHREDGPAVEYADGSLLCFINGSLHREDGPAIEFASGEKQWCWYGRRNREAGPAIEYPNGEKQWWINGERIK